MTPFATLLDAPDDGAAPQTKNRPAPTQAGGPSRPAGPAGPAQDRKKPDETAGPASEQPDKATNDAAPEETPPTGDAEPVPSDAEIPLAPDADPTGSVPLDASADIVGPAAAPAPQPVAAAANPPGGCTGDTKAGADTGGEETLAPVAKPDSDAGPRTVRAPSAGNKSAHKAGESTRPEQSGPADETPSADPDEVPGNAPAEAGPAGRPQRPGDSGPHNAAHAIHPDTDPRPEGMDSTEINPATVARGGETVAHGHGPNEGPNSLGLPHPADRTGPPATANLQPAAPAANAPVPIAGLAVEIAARAQAGRNRFEIRLDPPELGRIDVRLDVDRNGNVTSRLVVDRAETLDVLRRDAGQLERALQDAGLKTSDNGLQFMLRDQSSAGRDDGQREHAARIVVPDADLAAIDSGEIAYRGSTRSGGLDIRV